MPEAIDPTFGYASYTLEFCRLGLTPRGEPRLDFAESEGCADYLTRCVYAILQGRVCPFQSYHSVVRAIYTSVYVIVNSKILLAPFQIYPA